VKSESKSKKWRSCLIQSELDTYGSWYSTWTTQIPQSMGMNMQIHFPLSCTHSKENLERHCPTTFCSRCKWHYLWTKPINSSNTHLINPETHHTFMLEQKSWWTQQHSQVSWRTQQYFDLHCCNLETFWSSKCWTKLSSKSWWVPRHVAQDYWSLSSGYKM